MRKIYLPVKRFGDIGLSIIGIVILSPLLLLIAALIKLESEGEVLFCQKRVGICKCHFMIYKFRTMSIDTPKEIPTHMLKNPDQYITQIGRFLRRTSLDELPQIGRAHV